MKKLVFAILALLVVSSTSSATTRYTIVFDIPGDLDEPIFWLDHPMLNGNPNAKMVVTLETSAREYQYSVFYLGFSNAWFLARNDFENLPASRPIVTIVDQASVLMHTTTAGNTQNDGTILSHPDLDGNPDARPMFTMDTSNTSFPTLNSPLGLFYFNGNNWVIFRQDMGDMPLGLDFQVFIPKPWEYHFERDVDAADIVGQNALMPDQVGFVTPDRFHVRHEFESFYNNSYVVPSQFTVGGELIPSIVLNIDMPENSDFIVYQYPIFASGMEP